MMHWKKREIKSLFCFVLKEKRKGLNDLRKQYVDVGIAEEHAVAFSSGMAKNGAKPVFAVVSTFLQRTYDQLSHDLAINNNPAVVLVFGGTLKGMTPDGRYIHLTKSGRVTYHPAYYTIDGRLLQPHLYWNFSLV